MANPISDALAAYANASKAALAPGLGARDEAQPSGFADLLQQAAGNAVDALKQGEKASLDGMMGKADIGQVAAALANAETTLQTVVAVRDRVISAYQDIIKMPI